MSNSGYTSGNEALLAEIHMAVKMSLAARAAHEAHDAQCEAVPDKAKLDVDIKAAIAKSPKDFNFTDWSGLPETWLIECFGIDIVAGLLLNDMVQLKPEETLSKQLSIVKRLPEPADFWDHLAKKFPKGDMLKQQAKAAPFIQKYQELMDEWHAAGHLKRFSQQKRRLDQRRRLHAISKYLPKPVDAPRSPYLLRSRQGDDKA